MSPRPLAGPRLQRVLALVPYVLSHPGATIDELSERFEVSPAELERDLALLPFCGLPPYTADRLMDVMVIDGEVEIRLAEYFERPLRLTPQEGLALLAAGRALLAVPGAESDGALGRALVVLEEALGATGRVAIDVGRSDHLEAIQHAATTHEAVEIEYFSFARDEMTTRVIEPWRAFHAFGAWYVSAWCRRADSERLFRLDRIRAVRPTGERFAPTLADGDGDDGVSGPVYHPSPDDLRVTLLLAPEAGWVVESYPHEDAQELADGRWRVVLAVSERAWLERLLLDLGPDVEVEGPVDARRTGAAAAARIRARYR